MANLIAFMAALALQAVAPAQAVSVPVASPRVTVLRECDASSDVAARVTKDAALEVHYSIAGAPTCYFVTVTVRGETVRGYVVDRELDAVAAFEESRVKSEQSAFKAPPPASAAPAVVESVKATERVVKAQEKKPVPKRKDVSM